MESVTPKSEPLETTKVDLTTRLAELLTGMLRYQSIEIVFSGFLVSSKSEDEIRQEHFQNDFKALWSSLQQPQQDKVVPILVAFANGQSTQARITRCHELLEMLINSGDLPARRVCETLLAADSLRFSNETVWHCTFKLMYRQIQKLDYKAVRSIFSLVLTRIRDVPDIVSSSQECLVADIKKVVTLVLDRQQHVLPGYFIANEICKMYPVENFKPHWAFGKEFCKFVDSFKPLAGMVTISGRSHLLPVIGHSVTTAQAWKLDPSTLRFPLKGLLPYNKDVMEPQKELLLYIIAQPYSRDMACSMLGLNKQQKERCPALEELLVDLIVIAMEKTESSEDGSDASHILWQHLSSQLIFFVLFQFASFPHMVLALHKRLKERKLQKGRDQLMWVLLQFISGSIQKSPLSDFLPVMKLFDALYPEKQMLEVPDISKPECRNTFAMACIWIHLLKKAQNEFVEMKRPAPTTLQRQLSCLQEWLSVNSFTMDNYKIAVLCNAYSTNPEFFSHPMTELVDTFYGRGDHHTNLPGPTNVVAFGPTIPCSMEMLDSLTVHAKMSLTHSIVQRVSKHATSQSTVALAPALLETYGRLLVYMEIELLCIKSFISQLLPIVFKSQAWGMLHTLLEMFSHRLPHIQPNYRFMLLSHLHSLAAVSMTTDKHQLHSCVQHTVLRLISGFGSAEVQPQLASARLIQDPKQVLSKDSEELNRVLVLTIARSMHVTGAETLPWNWCEGVLQEAIALTPHSWPPHTLECFPKVLQQFYEQNNCAPEVKQTLLKRVEEAIIKFKSTTDPNEIVNHFTGPQAPNIFLCVVWKILFETGTIPHICYQVLVKLLPKQLSTCIRVFTDYLVYQIATSVAGKLVNKCIQNLNDMVWKYNVFTLDRLILSMALRHHGGNEAQVCFFIIQLLLLKHTDFRDRVQAFVKDNSPHHWKQTDWHEKHTAYHQSFPERFHFEGILQANNMAPQSPQYFPVYFGNVCLRFLPVFDIVIHRFLELPPVSKSLETLLEHLGQLYKFHDRPITYLYNTLYYYEERLREKDRSQLKRKLVGAVMGAQQECHNPGWALTESYLEFLARDEDTWIPDHAYYSSLLARLVDTIGGRTPDAFKCCDWRFNEFPNPSAHALYITCVELMALPLTGPEIGNALFDVISKRIGFHGVDVCKNPMDWINAASLVLTSLPEPCWSTINIKVCDVLKNDLSTVTFTSMSPLPSFFDFTTNQSNHCETRADYVIALFHGVWHHSTIGQFTLLPRVLKEIFRPLIVNEAQLLYVMCLVGPFLQRFRLERTRCLFEVAEEFYHITEQVCCQGNIHFQFADVIADVLYFLKYMFVGDHIKETVEKTIVNFNHQLQTRLRFMTGTTRNEDETTGS